MTDGAKRSKLVRSRASQRRRPLTGAAREAGVNGKIHAGRGARGQGMTEYIIIVSLIAIAAIGIVSLFGDNIRKLFGASAQALAGDSSVANPGDSQQHDELRKKKMSNFGQNNSY